MNRDQRLLVERLRGHLVRHSYHGHQTVRRPVASDASDRLIVLDQEFEDHLDEAVDGTDLTADTTDRGPTAVG